MVKKLKAPYLSNQITNNSIIGFIERFQAEFITTNDLWLGHYPIRSTGPTNQKSTREIYYYGNGKKAIKISVWETQLRDLLAKR